MKTVTVINHEVFAQSILVSPSPNLHIKLGGGGHQRATRIILEENDKRNVIVKKRACMWQGTASKSFFKEKPQNTRVCPCCGAHHSEWTQIGASGYYECYHPKSGEQIVNRTITDLRGYPFTDNDANLFDWVYAWVRRIFGLENRCVVLWKFEAPKGSTAKIMPGYGVRWIAFDQKYYQDRKNICQRAEMLVVLNPGQRLFASLTTEGNEILQATLKWDGEKIQIVLPIKE